MAGGVQFRRRSSVGLYGVLAAHLSSAVTLSRQLYVCAEMRKFSRHSGTINHHAGKRVFCDECKGGTRVGDETRMRDLRARQRSLKPQEMQRVKTLGVKTSHESM